MKGNFGIKKDTPITQDVYLEPSIGIHLHCRYLLPVRVQSVLVDLTGIEPATSSLRTRRSPN